MERSDLESSGTSAKYILQSETVNISIVRNLTMVEGEAPEITQGISGKIYQGVYVNI